MAIGGSHAAAVSRLPDLHKDPFDRILIAQAIVEGIILLTADQAVLAYPGPIRSAA
jgi:PIN domain nuclease of toxin-antitoxin system